MDMPLALWIDNGDGKGPIRNPDISDADFNAGLANLQNQNIAILWQTAHDYEYAQINGTGVGLLAVGVLKGGPLALAIQNWCNSIWNLYYTRKPLVTYNWDPTLVDFSSCGDMPGSIPDLMAEVLGTSAASQTVSTT